MKHLQNKQFKHEIKNLEAMQQSAYDQMRFHRFGELTIYPLPTIHREILFTATFLFLIKMKTLI